MASVDVLVLVYVKLTEHALPLTRGSARAAGFDLCIAYDAVNPASGHVLIKTDIAIQLP
jgi:dUTPase